MNKYNRQLKGITVDVYDVLKAFDVTDPALSHLAKKALCTGIRGHKDRREDLVDILDSAKRALEMHDESIKPEPEPELELDKRSLQMGGVSFLNRVKNDLATGYNNANIVRNTNTK